MSAPTQPLKILLIEDDPQDARLLARKLSRADPTGLETDRVPTLAAGLEALATGGYDLTFVDLALPDSRGLACVERIRERLPRIPIIVFTGSEEEGLGVEAVRAGAQDYFVKWRADGRRLVQSIHYAIARKKLERDRREGAEPLREAFPVDAGGGVSSADGEPLSPRIEPSVLDRLENLSRNRERGSRTPIGEKISLGRYRIEEILGEGSMGTVFRGWDPKLKRSVALKTIQLVSLSRDHDPGELVVRLLEEAITLASLSHPHVVAVYDVNDAREAAFIAMEYVDGTDLESYLEARGALPWQEVLVLGLALARGLAAAHDRNLVHHDVKPGNVLLGRNGAVKVTDFGLARCVTTVVRGSASVCGTPGYLPPETLLGEGYDPSGDLFALGAILYRCLTGFHPFAGDSTLRMIRNTLFGELQPPSHHVPTIDPELDGLVVALLARERGERRTTSREVVEKLEERAFHHQLRWRPPSTLPATPRRSPEHTKTQLVPVMQL